MANILFDQLVFGPIKSRRLGVSLGLNLLPTKLKVCNFDCVYCECGKNKNNSDIQALPSRLEIRNALETKLCDMMLAAEKIDVITFAGNGEPTLHPEFEGIVEDVIFLRDAFMPHVKIAVLSNATNLDKVSVFDALNRVDLNILKLDSAINRTYQVLNRPNGNKNVCDIIQDLKRFKGKFILQTMFVSGWVGNVEVDNTTDEEIENWVETVRELNPSRIMIYSLDREPAELGLKKVSAAKLNDIAAKVKKYSYKVLVTS